MHNEGGLSTLTLSVCLFMKDPSISKTPPSALQGCLARYLRGTLLQIAVVFGVLLVWGSCVVVGTPVLLLLQAPSDAAFLITFVGGLFVTLTVFFGGIAVWRVRRDRNIDAVFTPLGLAGRMHMMSGRRHEGDFHGAHVETFFYRGPILDIFLYAPFGAEATFGVDNLVARAAADLLSREPIATTDPALADFRVFAADQAWIGRVLADNAAREAIVRLLRTPGPGSPLLQFQADRLLLRFAYADIRKVTTEQLRGWLTEMLLLAQRLAELPPPEIPAQPHLLDQKVRSSLLASPWGIMGIALGVVVVLMTCGLVGTFLVLALSGGI